MPFRNFLLAAGICVGIFSCQSNQQLSETSLLQPTTINTIAQEFKINVNHRATNLSCHGLQSQSCRYVYLQASTQNSSYNVLHNPPAEIVQIEAGKTARQCITALIGAAKLQVLSLVVLAFSSSSVPVLFVSFLWLYFTGSLFFDITHYFLHKFSKSRYWILRRIGYLHEVHHLYFNRRLKFNDRYLWQNMVCELPLELSCQLFGTWMGYIAAQTLLLTGPGLLSQELFHLVLLFEVIRSFVVAILEGRDSNHQSYSTVVPKDPHFFLVGPEYHALHHVDPSAYISSSFRVFDWFLGTSYTLRSRRVTMVGLSKGLREAMTKELQSKESVNCIREVSIDDHHEKIIESLANTDVLIIGFEEASCESSVKFIELFMQHYKARPGTLLLPELWYTESQTITPSSSSRDRHFTNYAREYYNAEDIIYRHVALSEATSKLLGPDFAAKVILWWVRRGARYIPITNPGSALQGYFNFFYGVQDQAGALKSL